MSYLPLLVNGLELRVKHSGNHAKFGTTLDSLPGVTHFPGC